MAIDGLGNTYGVPIVKKERETNMNQQKKQQKRKRDKKKEEETEHIIKEGKIDIRI